MTTDQDGYRQLLALVLLAASRAAVDFITNPRSREERSDQLKEALAGIDYDAVARAVTGYIDSVASSSKDKLSDTIDTLRDNAVDAVDEAKARAEQQTGRKKGGSKLRILIGLILGGLIAYFVLDEQRRDDLLDRLTGASGPIQQSSQSVVDQASSTAQQAAGKASDAAKNVSDAGGATV